MIVKDFIELAHREGVSHAENFPFWLEPETPAAACVVLVHGFSATPREMRPLGEALIEHGFAALGVRLPGHGTSPEDLSRRKHPEWIATVRTAINIAETEFERVYAAGLSTGSLALLTAADHGQLAGQVLLAPFLKLKHPMAPFVWFLRHLLNYDTRTIEPELEPFYYSRRPLKAIHELIRLTREVRHHLAEVRAPSLVIASEGDATADHLSAIELFEKLGSKNKKMELFGEDVPHAMLGDDNPRRNEIIRMCVDFFQKLENGNQDFPDNAPVSSL
mgnify:CR=1 FL=1